MRCRARCSAKVIQPEESLQRRSLHARRVGKAHVVFDQRKNLLRLIVRKTKAPADLRADRHAHFHVPVKANAVGRFAKRRRLAHIVQQRAPRQRQSRSPAPAAPAASACASTRRPRDDTAAAAATPFIRALRAAPASADRSRPAIQKPAAHGPRSASSSAHRERARGSPHECAQPACASRAVSLASISNPNRAANRTARNSRKLVLFKSPFRPPDGANDARIEIRESADIIDHSSIEP